MLYENPMPKEQYSKYIKSAEWKAKRQERLEMDKYTCRRCGSPYDTVVHHITYKNIGHEEMEDLITLCSWCHKRIHGIAKIISKKEFKEVTSPRYIHRGWVAWKGGDKSIEEMWNITRMPPVDEYKYRFSSDLCKSLDAEMDGAGEMLSSLSQCMDEEFNAMLIPTITRKLKKGSRKLVELDRNKILDFLESKKLIVRNGREIMVHPYLNEFERNEVSELCYYNRFCDLWESLHCK